jgi:hypothetical protein
VKLKKDIVSPITITSPVSLDAMSAFWGGGELIKYLLLLPLIQGSQHLPQNPTIEDSAVSPFFNLALKQAVLPLQNQFKSYCFGPKLARLESTNL